MITPVTHSEEIVRRLPHAEFVRIHDSGHVVMLEHADEVNAALVQFLEQAVGPVTSARCPRWTTPTRSAAGWPGVLRAGDLVLLTGPLGAGKTALTQGIGAGLGVLGDITSPTFVIARVHRPDPARGGTGGAGARRRVPAGRRDRPACRDRRPRPGRLGGRGGDRGRVG